VVVQPNDKAPTLQTCGKTVALQAVVSMHAADEQVTSGIILLDN
jgi:hypothetical protein